MRRRPRKRTNLFVKRLIIFCWQISLTSPLRMLELGLRSGGIVAKDAEASGERRCIDGGSVSRGYTSPDTVGVSSFFLHICQRCGYQGVRELTGHQFCQRRLSSSQVREIQRGRRPRSPECMGVFPSRFFVLSGERRGGVGRSPSGFSLLLWPMVEVQEKGEVTYRRIGSDITCGQGSVTDSEGVKPPESDPQRIEFAADGSKLSA